MSEISKPLSEAHLTSLIHSVATYSEKTLSAGARIIDHVVRYASAEMQNWEFQQDIEQFKNELIESLDFSSHEYYVEIDRRVDEFLEEHGIKTVITDDEAIDNE